MIMQNSGQDINYLNYYRTVWLMSLLLLQGVGIISVFFICASIVIFCLKTHPSMRVPVIHNVTVASSANETAWTLDKHGTNAHDAFFYLECLCNAWFTFELLIRSVLQLSPAIKANLFGPF